MSRPSQFVRLPTNQFFAAAARHHHILTRLAAHHMSLIPGCGRMANEIEGGLILIGLRIIGNHLKRRIVDRIHRQLLGARSHHYRSFADEAQIPRAVTFSKPPGV